MDFIWKRKRRRIFDEDYIGTPLSHISRAFLTVQENALVTGTIAKKDDEEGFLVQIGNSILALLPKGEQTCPHTIGESVTGIVKTIDPISARVIVSEKDAQDRVFFQECIDLEESGKWLEGEIAKVVKGGFLVPFKERMAILPFSQTVPPPIKPEEHLGETIRFRIMQVNPEAKKLVLTQKEKEKQPIDLEEGMKVKGVVTKIVPYGVFVRVDQHTGLVHKSEISWLRVHDIEDFVEEGNEIEVQVIGIEEENNKISLSIKRLQPNPWDNVEQLFQEGETTEGVVIHHAPFGLFLSLQHGLEGLLHISEIPKEDQARKEEKYPLGATVKVKIASIEKAGFRIGLTLA